MGDDVDDEDLLGEEGPGAESDASSSSSQNDDADNEPLVCRMRRVKAAADASSSYIRGGAASAAPAAPASSAASGAASKAPSTAPGTEMVAQVIEVYWPLDDAWYAAQIVNFQDKLGKHKVTCHSITEAGSRPRHADSATSFAYRLPSPLSLSAASAAAASAASPVSCGLSATPLRPLLSVTDGASSRSP